MTQVPRALVALVVGFILLLPATTSLPVAAASAGSGHAMPGMAVLTGNIPVPVAEGKARKGDQIASTRPLLVTFGLALRNEPALDRFIADDALHGRYLTQAQFAERFAPYPSQVHRVERWAAAWKLRLVYASPDGLVVTVRGRATQFEAALHVRVRHFTLGARSFFANTSAPSVPRSLGIQSITGLDNVEHAVWLGLRKSKPRPMTVPGGGFNPRDLRIAYNFDKTNGTPYSVNGTPVDGTGQTIGITGFGQSVSDSDLRAFARDTGDQAITSCTQSQDSLCNTAPDKVQWFLLDGKNSDPSLDEQALDVEYTHGLALHSHVKYWLGDDGSDPGMEDAVAAAASDPSLHVVSNSWGDPGPESMSKTNPFVVTTTNSFKQAVAVGTTFYFSTGDNAVDSGCPGNTPTHCGVPTYPATSPYVVAVGGTNLQMNSTLTTWASESAWNLDRGDDLGSGGGCAAFFRRPVWQKGVEGATCPGRAIPDISAVADLNNSPVEVWVYGGPEGIGGTSVSASVISGLAAVTNRYLSLMHASDPTVPDTMGFAAPKIYRLAQSADYNAYFHDVLCGSNTFPAGPGWDEATGWGSINWYPFARGFAGLPVDAVPPRPTWACDEGVIAGSSLAAVACSSRFHCHVGGDSGTLLNATDGWHWLSPAHFSGQASIVSLSCPGPRTCYALGRQGWLQKTTDGGKNWSVRRLGIGPTSGIACPAVSACYIVGAGILKAYDGSHFVREVAPSGSSLIAVSCSSTSTCYAIRRTGAVLKTTDGGQQWIPLVASPPGGTLADLACPALDHCIAVGTASTKNAQGGSALVYSTVDGAHWSSQIVGNYKALSAISCSRTSACDAVGAGGAILRTIDGVTWNPAADLSDKTQLDAVDCPVAGLCYAAGEAGKAFQLGAAPGY